MSTTPAVAVVVTKCRSKCTPVIPTIIDYSNPKMPYGFTQSLEMEYYVNGLHERGVRLEDFASYFLYKETYKNTKDMSSFESYIQGIFFDIAMEEYARRHRLFLEKEKM